MLQTVYLTKSKIRGALLGILFSKPDEAYYLSELARLVKASIGSAQRELERFAADGLIQRRKKGNLVFYSLNQHHALYPELRSLVLKTVGVEGEIRAVVTRFKDIRLALIYGSFARGDEKGESDIDLLVVMDGNSERFYAALAKLELLFRREINPTVYARKEFIKKIKAKDSFLTHVLKQPYRLLKGTPREFETPLA